MTAHSSAPEYSLDLMTELVERLEGVDGFDTVVASLAAGEAATLDGVWGSSCALAVAALARRATAPVMVVLAHPRDVDDFLDDLSNFLDGSMVSFPALESAEQRRLDDAAFGERLRLLRRMRTDAPPKVIVATVQSLLEPVPTAEQLDARSRRIEVGAELDLEELSRWLVEGGFEHLAAVRMPGEFSVHGGIVDIFGADAELPIRIELFGDTVDSIRQFDVETQRSVESLGAVEVTSGAAVEADSGSFVDYALAESWWMVVEPREVETEGRRFRSRHSDEEASDGRLASVSGLLSRLYDFGCVTAEAISGGAVGTTCSLGVESVERFAGEVADLRQQIDEAAGEDEVYLVCETEAEAKRLGDLMGETRLAAAGRMQLRVGRLRTGFRLVSARTTVLSASELLGRAETRRTRPRRLGRVIDSFLELREGDLVVHVGHGIARYRGLKKLEKEDQVEEHLELEFHGGTTLYVPASRVELVQKYVGGSKARPTLARLGGKTWANQKTRAEEAATDLAAEMLELEAARESRPGIRFPLDTEWQNEFDAAFPYRETDDQLAAIEAIKQDMHRDRPMDRLLCGDVGYGKTEVAMRAAFKAVESGYQVAVLVPTTILAEQHRRTFSDRMAEYPFTITSLSRFRTKKQQTAVLEALETGDVDIVIGTHRLVQPDVQFKNLGLVLIDEEQRFGVGAKERLKTLRTIVDVLTMTATPIPRTLHMSLLGLRDISNLETPPEDRMAVETRVSRFDANLVRSAVLRELDREGQIFFVHNRVHDIEIVAERLKQIVPEASVRIGHGQMAEGELEKVMVDFVNRKFDMLLATTIVESGLDIPNANTIFIDQADMYGLADLHQLRGRVGRYKHRAHCYLLVDPNKSLNPNSAKRLRAIEEFSNMGAGFAIAMRDLEIRGAGNIIGSEQSGHISTVGYELYCQLLERAVRRLRKMPAKPVVDVNIDLPGEAFLPQSYVPEMRIKIDLYRRLSRIASEDALADFAAELEDRFGEMPTAVRRLIGRARLRIAAMRWGIRGIRREDRYAVLEYDDGGRMRKLAERSVGRIRVADGQSAYVVLDQGVTDTDGIAAQVESLLRVD